MLRVLRQKRVVCPGNEAGLKRPIGDSSLDHDWWGAIGASPLDFRVQQGRVFVVSHNHRSRSNLNSCRVDSLNLIARVWEEHRD